MKIRICRYDEPYATKLAVGVTSTEIGKILWIEAHGHGLAIHVIRSI